MEIQRVAISSLTPDPTNARRHGKKNMEAIKGSLAKFGQVEPIIVNSRTGIVVGGNGRLTAMAELGHTECDVVRLDLNAVEASALALALNRTGELAEWDEDVLGKTLTALKSEGFGLLDIGFDASFFAAISDDVEGGTSAGGGDAEQVFSLSVTCESDDQQQELFTELRDRGFKVKA